MIIYFNYIFIFLSLQTKEETTGKETRTKKSLDFNDYDNDSTNSFNNKCKRFSTTSEILIKKSTNQGWFRLFKLKPLLTLENK